MKRVGLRCINHEHVVRMHLRQQKTNLTLKRRPTRK